MEIPPFPADYPKTKPDYDAWIKGMIAEVFADDHARFSKADETFPKQEKEVERDGPPSEREPELGDQDDGPEEFQTREFRKAYYKILFQWALDAELAESDLYDIANTIWEAAISPDEKKRLLKFLLRHLRKEMDEVWIEFIDSFARTIMIDIRKVTEKALKTPEHSLESSLDFAVPLDEENDNADIDGMDALTILAGPNPNQIEHLANSLLIEAPGVHGERNEFPSSEEEKPSSVLDSSLDFVVPDLSEEEQGLPKPVLDADARRALYIEEALLRWHAERNPRQRSRVLPNHEYQPHAHLTTGETGSSRAEAFEGS